ncbi:MAG TPA: glycerophosphodiester phosphodiesterase [Capillimicrobium sp.]|nr:glycerophosphodiester phosphodiesterase [Capillimicrobium sp.]
MPAVTAGSDSGAVAARRYRRVGHKGADHIAPGNTHASFDAALAHGVDMIEFDVLPERMDGTGELYLAHDYGALRAGNAPTLEEGLAHLAGETFAAVELDVDLKLPGYELRVLDALRRFGLLERALVSSMERPSLAVLREAEPALRLGWSVPKLRRDPFRSPWTAVPGAAFGAAYRAALPRRAAAAIRDGHVDALMAHWRLVSRALVRRVQAAGGELYVWTVDDRRVIERLEALGVDGVITNDPRLFDPII